MQKILYQDAVALYESETGQTFNPVTVGTFFINNNLEVQPRFVCPKCFMSEIHETCPLPN